MDVSRSEFLGSSRIEKANAGGATLSQVWIQSGA